MLILKARSADTDEIFRIMSLAGTLLEDRAWYCIDTKDYILEHIRDERLGVVWKAVEQDRIAAFFIIHYPGCTDSNLGHHIYLDEEDLNRVAYMDSLAVLPEFRGQGLQYRLMKHGEEQLSFTPYCHLMGTVHPDNTYSLNNFLKLGYRIVDTTLKYGSLPRHILYKKI